jgi:hypothetical protein
MLRLRDRQPARQEGKSCKPPNAPLLSAFGLPADFLSPTGPHPSSLLYSWICRGTPLANSVVQVRQNNLAGEENNFIPYKKLSENLAIAREQLKRPLTYAEKILYSHLDDPHTAGGITRGQTYLKLRPDRVACQDATAQMALLQFMSAGIDTVRTVSAAPIVKQVCAILMRHSSPARSIVTT